MLLQTPLAWQWSAWRWTAPRRWTLHPPAITRSFRFGPVVGFVRASGPPPIDALAAMVRSAAERQQARVRGMIAADAVLEVDAPTPDEVAATTAHISPRRSR